MTIERTPDAIIVKLPPDTSLEEIEGFLNYLRYKQIVDAKKTVREDLVQLAQIATDNWWEQNKHHFTHSGTK